MWGLSTSTCGSSTLVRLGRSQHAAYAFKCASTIYRRVMCWLIACVMPCAWTGTSNESFFSEIRAAAGRALELFRAQADAVVELNIVINSLHVHVTPRSTDDAQAAAAAWEAATDATTPQPAGPVDDKLLTLLLERSALTLVNSTATFDIYEPFQTESDRGAKLAVEELLVDRLRFR